MIEFSNLVAAIQNAAEQAAFSVSQQNFKILMTYFNVEKEVMPAQGVTDEQGRKEPQILAPESFEHLTPKSIKLKFPKITEDGPMTHDVHVPLISLSPVTNMQLSEIEIDMDMDILEKDGELMVGFPHQKKSFFGPNKTEVNTTNTRIKIKIAPGDKSTGVTTIVDGYEKVLRAQIPS